MSKKKLSFDNIRTYLEKSRIAYISTIDNHGYPNTFPVWFASQAMWRVNLVRMKAKSKARHYKIIKNGANRL
jgi:hypothetical protein